MEMIAMLDGLGMNADGSYPIGDVNPNTSTRNYKAPPPPSKPPEPPQGIRPYEPMSYTLGSLGAADEEYNEDTAKAESERGSSYFPGIFKIGIPGILAVGALIFIAIPLLQKFMPKRKPMNGMEELPPGAGMGFAEPEMIQFPPKKRRKRRAARRRSRR